MESERMKGEFDLGIIWNQNWRNTARHSAQYGFLAIFFQLGASMMTIIETLFILQIVRFINTKRIEIYVRFFGNIYFQALMYDVQITAIILLDFILITSRNCDYFSLRHSDSSFEGVILSKSRYAFEIRHEY